MNVRIHRAESWSLDDDLGAKSRPEKPSVHTLTACEDEGVSYPSGIEVTIETKNRAYSVVLSVDALRDALLDIERAERVERAAIALEDHMARCGVCSRLAK